MLRATLVATQKGGINRALLAGRLVKPSDYSTLVVLPLKCFDGAPFRGCVPIYRFSSGGGGDDDKNKKPPTGFAMPNIGTDFGVKTPAGGASELGETSTLMGVKASGDNPPQKDNVEALIKRLKNVSKSYDGPQDKGNEEGPLNKLDEIFASVQKNTGKTELCDQENRGQGEFAVPEKNIEKKSAAENPKSGSVEEATERVKNQLGELPSKEQLKKYFLRIVAFLYDLSFLAVTWAISFVEKNVIENPTVKAYWKKFHEKMQQAKKD
ncbi:uncharacterized protein [Drosophila pseudoobscura]|uniref:Uncharacterized protein n=1 Tax=Drosophila pseudoobscura pseudoobscura TaxID=46245 RepID=A0A6I8UEC5_DROPS|nr:uncharacterized protein LOC4814019 [Drosophila pseudoobscura]